MNKEYVLYGKRKQDRFEELLIVRNTREALEPYIKMAKEQGFRNIRVVEHDYSDMPDFAATVNI